MKLYFLDEDPIVAAQSLAIHTTNQAIIHATYQLSNAYHIHNKGNERIYQPRALATKEAQWTADSIQNYNWVLKYVISLLNNHLEHRKSEHKSRFTVSHLLEPPMDAEAPLKVLRNIYEEREEYTKYLKEDLKKGTRVEFYGEIPHWTGFEKGVRQQERVHRFKRFSPYSIEYEREYSGIEISAVKPLYRPVDEVDIRKVAEPLEEDID